MPPSSAINTADGLAYCMGNEELYSRLLHGFRTREAGFADEVRDALSAARWADAQRRTHDLKGLAGTIGAHGLRSSAQKLQDAVIARDSDAAVEALGIVRTELEAVLAEIDPQPLPG